MNTFWCHYIIIQHPVMGKEPVCLQVQWSVNIPSSLSLISHPPPPLACHLFYYLMKLMPHHLAVTQVKNPRIITLDSSVSLSAPQPVRIDSCPLAWQFCFLNMSLNFSHLFIVSIAVLAEVQNILLLHLFNTLLTTCFPCF